MAREAKHTHVHIRRSQKAAEGKVGICKTKVQTAGRLVRTKSLLLKPNTGYGLRTGTAGTTHNPRKTGAFAARCPLTVAGTPGETTPRSMGKCRLLQTPRPNPFSLDLPANAQFQNFPTRGANERPVAAHRSRAVSANVTASNS